MRDLFENWVVGGEKPKRERLTPRQRFERFHAQHPEVYQLFRRFACELLHAGHARYSGRTIMERIRWEYATAIDRGEDGFRINDHVTPFYVRLLIREHPVFETFFELRAVKS